MVKVHGMANFIRKGSCKTRLWIFTPVEYPIAQNLEINFDFNGETKISRKILMPIEPQ